ncbi:hypothetical protein AB4Y88_03695 [Paenarthrobacter sp. RAF9]
MIFPDFSAFQIDIPYGLLPSGESWAGERHPDPDLYSAFWPEVRPRGESGLIPATGADD